MRCFLPAHSLLLGMIGYCLPSLSQADEITLLTYNVAGLPEIISGANPSVNTSKISPLLNDYDIVAVQEDFNFHSDLISQINHSYQTQHAGSAGIGDGLNRFSRVDFTDYQRQTWDDCHGIFSSGSDCLTKKGFSFARHRTEEGAVIDIYNLHADAGSDDASKAARRSNLRQVMAAVDQQSQGHAVIVMGDTNTRYTRNGDIIKAFADIGFKDAWVELARNGDYPRLGNASLTNCQDPSSGDCEIVDKLLFRSSAAITLTPTQYDIPREFVDEKGERLSDHYPVAVSLTYRSTGVKFTSTVGGPHGGFFNDLTSSAVRNNKRVTKIGLRSGRRIDAIEFTYSNGESLTHGGNTGSYQSMSLAADEVLKRATVCQDKKGTTRVFYLRLETNKGRSLEGGSSQGACQTFDFSQEYIVGAYGRSGKALDRLGFLYR